MGSVAKTVGKLIPHEITNTLDKVIPNEIKPALPFAAAAFPFLAPVEFAGLGSLGGLISNPIAQRAIAGGLTNLVSQGAQEGYDKRGLNLGSLGLASLGGALTAPSSAFGELYAAPQTMGGFEVASSDLSSLDKAQNAILGGAQKASNFFDAGVKGLDSSEGIFNTDFLKAYAPGAIGAASDLAYNAAKDKALEFQKQQAALGQTATANKQNQIDYIRKAMVSAGFNSNEIDDALKRSGFAYGGRAGYGLGGDVLKALGELSSNIKYGGGFKKGIARTYENVKKPILDKIARFRDDIDIRISDYDYAEDSGVSYNISVKPKTKKGETIMNKLAEENPFEKEWPYEGIQKERDRYYLPQGEFATQYLEDALSRGARASGVTTDLGDFYRTKDMWKTSSDPYGNTLSHGEADVYDALSKYQKKAEGGLMSLHGHEMDFRDGGGFVPLGQKERADDVPARLSKNEFVFTAKAVRNAGGGDIKEGAKRMYQIMKQLEAKA